MARRHHYRRRTKENAYEIDVTTFLNLMVVLVPFLLITAVFSRLTIVELNLPSTAGGATSDADSFRVEVIVREPGIEISFERLSKLERSPSGKLKHFISYVNQES